MTTTVLAGRYRLGAEIGAGGTGSVFRARDEHLGRDVAVKLLRTGADATDCERLRREVEYLEQVHHPNLVAVLDAGADRIDGLGTAWFAMELVRGPDLRRLLRERGPMDGAAARRLLEGLLAALGALHAAGLVHRDVTPANILLTADPFARWDVKLTDLGIAQRLRADRLTGVGEVVGTAAYLSPEQVTGSPVGPASDVYAAALVTLEAITGRPAFPGTAAESATARLVRRPALPNDLDQAWSALLEAATALDPDARPSVGTLLDAARSLPDGTGLDPERIEAPGSDTDTAASTARATAVQPVQGTAVLVAVPAPRGARRLLVGVSAALLLVAAGTAGTAAVVHGVVLAGQHATADRATAPRATATPTATPTAAAPAAQDPVQQADPVQAGPVAPPAGGPGGPAAGPGAGPP